MMLVAAFLGVSAAESILQESGAACVAEVPRLILEEINTLRSRDLTGNVYQLLELYAEETSYLFDDGTEIGCFADDETNCSENALEEYTFITEALTTFDWSPGLAMAAEDLRETWINTGFQSLQQPDGSDTWSRAKKYGIVGGSLSEFAFWLDAGENNTMKIKATDCVLTMLIGDGDSEKVARNAIFDTSATGKIYTQIGAAVGSRLGDRYVMCDIIFAENYEES